jgi:hypothetical protein
MPLETRFVFKSQPSDEVDEVEDQLFESFKPVIPDPEFVRRLQHRLVAIPETIIEPRYKIENILIILLGISTGFIVLIFVRWLIKKMLLLF